MRKNPERTSPDCIKELQQVALPMRAANKASAFILSWPSRMHLLMV